jgi:endonuclease/exonuclease/phosphatase family metal-dependent hydrolase
MNRFTTSIIFIFVSLVFSTAQTGDFRLTTWNTEWLSCENYGPSDEELQINNVVAVIRAMNSDVVALQEVGTSSTYSTIDTLVRRLGSEWGGSMVTSSVGNCSQNEGIIYKKARVQLVSSSLISNGGSSYDWSSGRYPVLYNINLLVDGTTVPVALINIHAKAMSDATSYERRKNASAGLKALLDGTTYNTKNVVLLGDFNDYLNGTQCSSCSPAESPYKNFVDDTQNYNCLTGSLRDPNYNSPVIDNIIISNELFDNYTNTVLREASATQTVVNFYSTTSDHTPVSAIFRFSEQQEPDCENLSFSETFAQSLGNFTQYSVQGSQFWYWREIYGANVSGYSSAVNYVNEDWLISPAFDLSKVSSALLSFDHAINYSGTESDKLKNQTLWVSTTYSSGDPTGTTWTPLTIPTIPAGNSWAFVNSGEIQIPDAMLHENARFAFKYLSDASVAGTWELKNLSLTGACIPTQTATKTVDNKYILSVTGHSIKIENLPHLAVSVYDITGRMLFSDQDVTDAEFTVNESGIYLVRIGNAVSKVAVK